MDTNEAKNKILENLVSIKFWSLVAVITLIAANRIWKLDLETVDIISAALSSFGLSVGDGLKNLLKGKKDAT